MHFKRWKEVPHDDKFLRERTLLFNAASKKSMHEAHLSDLNTVLKSKSKYCTASVLRSFGATLLLSLITLLFCYVLLNSYKRSFNNVLPLSHAPSVLRSYNLYYTLPFFSILCSYFPTLLQSCASIVIRSLWFALLDSCVPLILWYSCPTLFQPCAPIV